MNKEQITNIATKFVQTTQLNYISKEFALRSDLVGMKIYEDPILNIGSAQDPFFNYLKSPQGIHENFMLPTEWLPDAKSIISIFTPFTLRIKEANAKDLTKPADEWLMARIEGQIVQKALMDHLVEEIKKEGYNVIAPTNDSRFKVYDHTKSNWSERHAAYVCGLGTFSLSKGLITKKGIAGRLSSIITNLELPVDERPYSGLYDYCINCGKCAINCPADAIDKNKDMAEAKSHIPCMKFVNATQMFNTGRSRYGCGKCQVAVPCRDRIPKKI
ncbi:4Fe-4S binding protein [Selenomonadales bacterium OttesenSCG-928-I06]|nr:4Fe-4S binding protein [Selenomonadales bacterium OttesenSCG-928-I06]